MTKQTSTTSTSDEAVLMRRATPDDTARIRRLACLDDKRMPSGPFLIAEIHGEIVAAHSFADGADLADPFRLTSDIVDMLRLRASQLSEPARRERRRAFRYALAT